MSITTMTSREFNQDSGGAKRAAEEGPVFITDRGITSHVLLTIDQYHSLSSNQPSIVDLLVMPGGDEIDFEPQPVQTSFIKATDFS